MRKTFRIKLLLDGDTKERVYRTDGIETWLCSYWDRGFYCWEKNTKYNGYNGWNGYINFKDVVDSLTKYNPDNLQIGG